MAIVRNNQVTQGFSGMFGGAIVFKNLRGKTIATNRPALPKKQSELQRRNRQRFKEATEYAHSVMLDPAKKEYYRRRAYKLKLPNAYTAAITDYLRRPIVKQVTVVKKKSQATSSVIIHAVKKGFTLASVELKIQDEQGLVLESGKATSNNHVKGWTYTPRVYLKKCMRVNIIVTDQLGNEVLFRGSVDTDGHVTLCN